ncbi:MAG TPA: DUF488 family protein [Candidatus Bathyarchaeia archaeon]|nr:DUF488 family protein [Candidatus Bathyarchaeia archaeon]
MDIRLKRAYEAPSKDDGARLLVERLWPRGLTKEKAAIDEWFRDIAPSPTLRRWYAHDPEKWEEFRRRYLEELRGNKAEVERLRARLEKGTATFVYAAKDEARNSAVVLKDYLERKGSGSRRPTRETRSGSRRRSPARP